MVRPTDENLADREKRICDSDYFPIYFRAAVPAEMFSEAELSSVVERLNNVTSEEAADRTFKAVLDGIHRTTLRDPTSCGNSGEL